MFQKILLATDGMVTSKRAEDLAFELAKSFGSTLTVLHVISSYLYEAKDLIPLNVGREEFKAHVDKEYGREVEKVRRHIAAKAEKYGVNFEFKVRKGKVSEEIVEEAQSCDAVVLGCKDLSGLARLKSEKTPEKVFKKVKCSIIVAKG